MENAARNAILTKPLNRSLSDRSQDAVTKAVSLEQSCSAVVNLRVFLDTDDSANTLLTGTTILFFFSLAFPEVPGRAVLSSVTSQPVASCVPVLSSLVVSVISDGESQYERVESQSTRFFRSQ